MILCGELTLTGLAFLLFSRAAVGRPRWVKPLLSINVLLFAA
ncbi:hypothetical protein [Lignipirellula cremea]|uniref:Uncharacterized protein n=1 Tax=Lignipirellula cremea TaxID=2528010 RepID=A0A518E3E0_9BACT|nr:hypothetical protein [Lignipirellula cremea]QDU98563.1 hypothetical protein Pla8534_64330 [Lignipirellula cremea]